ncbi:amino acid/amide ABC transporter ATP-binding protein 1, HAAT family [Methylobacterium sp. 174MFSha1.1]|uniref:ABC transporter ATP-binding protein n=1 Tax=Methylobacterium sp. 174MFSha1.1 TaxID=1502749 RepID=UPI0008EF423B|nr:ATP-binding cassette domain-containing protein [Methylobacterium sp. 174MFSha1.1]SFV13580.1 amino acid/amide ABC transporter ATP-binding protein 1, HAAT family [Methylobacterium sp. 174MFSha1.1]
MTSSLSVQGLFAGYGKTTILKDVSVEVATGERHVVIGPNGAGKTTFFRSLCGEVPAMAGRILFEGRDVTALAGFRRVRAGIGRSFQVARIFGEMNPIENVVVAIEARGEATPRPSLRVRPRPDIRDEAEAMLADLGLDPREDSPARILSHGDKKRLELAMMLALRPRLLLLDEPTAGMASGDRRASVRLVERIVRETGATLILTEHDMDVVFQIGTRISVLHYGEIVASGTPDEVRANAFVRDIYLGRGGHHG